MAIITVSNAVEASASEEAPLVNETPTAETAVESTEVSNTESEADASVEEHTDDAPEEDLASAEAKNGEMPSWVKARLARQERKFQKQREAELAELQELRAKVTQAQAPAPVQLPSLPQEEVEPSVEDFPDDFIAYNKAYNEFIARKVFREQQVQLRSQQEGAIKNQRMTERVKAFAEVTPDFIQVVQAVPPELRLSGDNFKDLHEAILDSEVGHEVAYRLAKDHTKLRELSGLSPRQQLLYFGRLEGQLLAEKTLPAQNPVKTEAVISKAPKPPAELKTGSAPSTSKADPSDYKAWKEAREAQLKAKR